SSPAVRNQAPKPSHHTPEVLPERMRSAVEKHGAGKTMSHIEKCLLEQDDIDRILIIFVLMPESIICFLLWRHG
ncbi:MAG: hypothetical protein PHP23_13385, partial [Desulfobacterales bacterium]|nr:hypothetical protein [Desulfobacterales bacterium]